jgi:tetratricopeptide (TPR) repeat protein
MIAALGFLGLSIAGSILIISGAINLPAPAGLTPSVSAVAPTLTRTLRAPSQPAPTDLPTAESTLLPTATPAGPALIGVAAAGENPDPAVGERIEAAFQTALQTAFLPGGPALVQSISLPPDRDPAQPIHIERDAPGMALLAVWDETETGVVRVYLYVAHTPPLFRVDQIPGAWPVYGTEGTPIYARRDGDFGLPALLGAAFLELQAGQTDRALERFRAAQALPVDVRADQRDANRAGPLFGIGQALAQQDNPTMALQMISQAIRLQSDFPAAQVNRGNIYLALGDTATALAAYDAITAANPTYLPAIYNRMLAYQQAGEHERALDEAGRLVELSEGSAWSLNLRGVIRVQQGNLEAALQDFEQASAAAPGAAVPVFNRAVTLYGMGSYQEALGGLDAALDIEPNNPTFFAYQGLMYQALGEMVRAERALNRAIDLDESYVDAYLWRGRLHLQLEQYQEAMADAGQALTLDPAEGRAHVIIGDARAALEFFEAAEEAYTQAIELGEDGAEVYAARGYAWHRRRYIGYAIRDYEAALERGSTDLVVLYRLSFAYYDDQRFDDSLEAIQAAVNGGLDEADAYAMLALALDSNLLRDEAEQAYRRALDLDDQYADLAYVRDLPLWSESMVARAQTILARLEDDDS